MSKTNFTNSRYAAAMGLVCVALVLCGCSYVRPDISQANSANVTNERLASIACALADIDGDLHGKHEPTPAPIDYSSILSSIDASLKTIAAKSEHSLVVPPAPPEPVKKKVCGK